jgi:hypothetical protein
MVTTEEKKVHSTPEEKNPQQGPLFLTMFSLIYNFTKNGLEKLYVKMFKICSSPEIKSDDFENG